MRSVWTILVDLFAGLVGKAIALVSIHRGFLLTAALAMGGSLAAPYLGQFFGWDQSEQVTWLIGAIALLGGLDLVNRQHTIASDEGADFHTTGEQHGIRSQRLAIAIRQQRHRI